jgi:AraC family transcriptional regulator
MLVQPIQLFRMRYMEPLRITPHFQSALLRIESVSSVGAASDSVEDEIPHDHEIVLIRAGAFLRDDAWGCTMLDANQVVFFQRQQPYQITHPVGGGDHSTVFALSDPLLRDLLHHAPDAAAYLEAPFPLGSAPITMHWQHKHHALLRALAHTDALTIEEETLLLLGEILQAAYHWADQRPEKRQSPVTFHSQRELVEQAKVFIAQHWQANLRLDAIAQAVAASPYWLCRIFKKHTGSALHQYVQQLRLAHALDILLARPDEPLTEIALKLGFYSHSHFTTMFRRAFGISPTTYRRASPQARKILEAPRQPPPLS